MRNLKTNKKAKTIFIILFIRILLKNCNKCLTCLWSLSISMCVLMICGNMNSCLWYVFMLVGCVYNYIYSIYELLCMPMFFLFMLDQRSNILLMRQDEHDKSLCSLDSLNISQASWNEDIITFMMTINIQVIS